MTERTSGIIPCTPSRSTIDPSRLPQHVQLPWLTASMVSGQQHVITEVHNRSIQRRVRAHKEKGRMQQRGEYLRLDVSLTSAGWLPQATHPEYQEQVVQVAE